MEFQPLIFIRIFQNGEKKRNTGWCQMPVLNLFYSELSVTPSVLSKSCIGVNGRLSLKIEHSPFFDLNLWLCQWHLEHLKLYLALLKAQTKDSHPESTGNVKSKSSLILNRTNHVSSVFVCLFVFRCMSTAAPGENPAVATTCPQSRDKLSALKQALRALGFNRLVHTRSITPASSHTHAKMQLHMHT